METVIRRGLFAAFALSVAAGAGAESLTLVTRITRGNEPPVTQTTYVTNEKMRTTGDASEVMVDFVSGNLTIIDVKKKEFTVVTPQDVEAMAAELKKMEKQLEALPAAIRDKMPGAAASVTVEKGAGGKTVAGYACENWVVTIGNSMRQDHCVTSALAYPVPAYDGMSRYMKAMGQMSPMLKGMDQLVEKFKAMKGLSIYHQSSMKMMGKSFNETSELVEVKKDAIPDAVWQVPAGFKQKQWKMGR